MDEPQGVNSCTDQKTIIGVCGTRSFGDITTAADRAEWVEEALATVVRPDSVAALACGHSGNADLAAEAVADKWGVPLLDDLVADLEFAADWDQYGKAAGPRRNTTMARVFQALAATEKYRVRWLAIWDGRSRGTADMLGKARGALDDDRVFVELYREGDQEPDPVPASSLSQDSIQLPTPTTPESTWSIPNDFLKR